MDFYFPASNSEGAAFASALMTILFGLVLMFAPRFSLRLLRLQTQPEYPEAVSESRATMAGFHIGVGLCAILLAQPLLYLALGAGWAFTAFGRIVSMMSDRGHTLFNWIALIVEATLAVFPILYATGLA